MFDFKVVVEESMDDQQSIGHDGPPDRFTDDHKKDAQAQLERSEYYLRQKQKEVDQIKIRLMYLNDFSPVGLLTMDSAGVIRDVNLRALDLFDAVRDELVGLSFAQLVQHNSRKRFQEHLQAVLYDEKLKTCQLELHRPHSQVFFAHLSTQISPDSGDKKFLQTVIVDVTDEWIKNEHLRQTGNHYHTWLKQLPQPVVVIDQEGIIRFASDRTLSLLGYPSEQEVLGKKVLGFVKHDDRQQAVKEITRLSQHDTVVDFRINLIHQNGSFLWADLIAGKIEPQENNSGIAYFAIIVRNLSDKKEPQQDLQSLTHELKTTNQELQKKVLERKVYQNKLSSLVMQMADLEDQERRRIATGLHDHVCQQLLLINLELKKARNSASTDVLDHIIVKNEALIQDVRDWTFELSPPVLYELGLVAALQWYAEKIGKEYPMKILIEGDETERSLDDITRNILFQSVRELFNNVVKHAQASEVNVRVFKKESFLSLEFKDNGVGFDTKTVFAQMSKTDHFGLFNIRERLHYIGGSFTAISNPDNGTIILLKAPLRHHHRRGTK
ncbi:PAS domain S-box protein [candidate division KSB1 bacterium]|nr:PAS domain S-box protein [candidate division KSB1 bacterium]